MIKSLNHYSKYPLILYYVNFDAPDFKGNYKNVIYKRINLTQVNKLFIISNLKLFWIQLIHLMFKWSVYRKDDIDTQKYR